MTRALLALALLVGCTSKIREQPDVGAVVPPKDDVPDVVEVPDEGVESDLGCPPTAACITEGTRCLDGELVECAIDPFGCLFLSVVACGEGEACVEDDAGARCEQADVCTGVSDCDEESAECDGQVALRCAPDEDGCLVRSFEDCGDAFCIDGACVADPCEGIASPCPTAGFACTGEVLQECAADEHGCLSVSPVVDCSEQPGSFCSPGPPASCKGEVQGPWIFIRVADLASTGPGGAFTFTGFGQAPALEAGRVVLRAALDGGPVAGAVLLYDQATDALSVVAAQGEPIPSGSGGFTDFDPLAARGPRLSGDRVVFIGNGSNAQRGIYLQDGSGLVRLVDRQTAIPGGETFVSLSEPLIAGPRLTFNGNDFGSTGGAYARTVDQVGVTTIGDKGTPMPNAIGTFVSIEATDLAAGDVVALSGFGNAPAGAPFSGTLRGVYRTLIDGGGVEVVADRFDGIPEAEQRFNTFGDPHLAGAATIFVGRGELGVKKPLGALQHKGIYRTSAEGLGVLADTQTLMPGGEELFSEEATDAFSDDHIAVDSGVVVFRGVGSAKSVVTRVGLYRIDPAADEPAIETIIDTDHTLEERSIADLVIGRQGAEGGAIAFLVRFTDGGEAVYLAMPTPEAP